VSLLLLLRGALLSVTITDAEGLTDTPITQGRTANGVDTLGLTDAATPVMSAVNNQTITDTIGINDTGVGEDLGDVFTPDPLGLTDNLVLAIGYDRSVTDPLGATESAVGGLAGHRRRLHRPDRQRRCGVGSHCFRYSGSGRLVGLGGRPGRH
jgi:hypothetical protein